MAEGHDQEELVPFDLCEDLVCCVVCYEPFSEQRTPKALPCLHSFCKSCLAACIIAHRKRSRPRNGDRKSLSGQGEFPCPVCNEKTKIPTNGLDGFRDDFRIRRILDILNKSRDAEQAEEASTGKLSPEEEKVETDKWTKCGMCRLRNLDAEAKQYCLDCFKLICDSCAEDHKTMALTSDHHVIGVPLDLNGCVVGLPLSSTCGRHRSELLRYYCKHCSETICMTCSLAEQHKEHDIVRLSDHVTDIRRDVTSVLNDVWSQVSYAEERLAEIESLERELSAKQTSVRRAILSKTLEEIFRARHRQQKMEEDLERICSTKKELLSNRRRLYDEFLDKARGKCSVVENIVQHGDELHVAQTVNQLLADIKTDLGRRLTNDAAVGLDGITDLGKYDALLNELYSNKRSQGEASRESCQQSILAEIRAVVSEIRQLSSSPVPTAEADGTTTDNGRSTRAASSNTDRTTSGMASSEGDRKTGNSRPASSGATKQPTNNTKPDAASGSVEDGRKTGTKLLKKIGRKGKQEGEFSFPSGITFLPNNQLAVADMHNYRVQIFDADGQFVRSFGGSNGCPQNDGDGGREVGRCLFKPCGVVATRQGNVALTNCLTGKSDIKVFTPEGRLVRCLGDGFFEYPFSIAVDPEDRFVVCDSATNRIVMLTEDGQLYRRFSTRTKFAFYLAVTSTGKEILVSDWFNHCVNVFDTNGALLRRIGERGVHDGQMMIPLGLCPDADGNILILDCKCGRVSMFTLDGSFVKHVIGREHGIEYSRDLALASNGRLAISSGDNRGNIPNEVRLYQI